MNVSGERYFPNINNPVLGPFEPYISYEHWHRYCYALPFVAGKKVLDIACGEGYGSAYMARRAARVYGVDVSDEAIEHARSTYVRDNLAFLLGSAGDIPIPGRECLDAIVSFETIEHLHAEMQECFAREVKRLLRPGGVLLISTPNRTVYTGTGDHHNPYHLREFTSDEFLFFLQPYFRHVQLLSQRVYPGSLIWNVDGRGSELTMYQIALKNGRFCPVEAGAKEIRYMIAVCTNADQPTDGLDSLMIDLTEVAFRGVPGLERWFDTGLYLDSGSDFRADEVVYAKVEYRPDFSVTFTLDPSVAYRRMRWDPLELRLCTVRLRSVVWQDGSGSSHTLDLDAVWSNALRSPDGTLRFESVDPMIVLPIAGSVHRVTIEGDCEVQGEADTLHGMEKLLSQRSLELLGANQVLAEQMRQMEEQGRGLHELEQRLKGHEEQCTPSLLLKWARSVLSCVPRRLRTDRATQQATRGNDTAPSESSRLAG
jgi:SAM-dependent methyltransferase